MSNVEPIFGVVYIIGCIIEWILLIIVCFQLGKRNQNREHGIVVSKLLLILGYVCSIIYIMSGLFMAITLISKPGSHIEFDTEFVQAILWHFGQICNYSYLISKLYNDFNDDVKTTRRLLSLLVYFYLIPVIFGLVWMFVEHLIKGNYHLNANDTDAGIFYIIATFIIDLLLSLSLLVIFCNKYTHKIKEYTLEIKTHQEESIKLMENEDNTAFANNVTEIQGIEDEREKISIASSKTLILGVTIVVLSVITYITGLFEWLFDDSIGIFIFWLIIRWFHIFGVPILLFMNLNFFNPFYLCCFSKCDSYLIHWIKTRYILIDDDISQENV